MPNTPFAEAISGRFVPTHQLSIEAGLVEIGRFHFTLLPQMQQPLTAVYQFNIESGCLRISVKDKMIELPTLPVLASLLERIHEHTPEVLNAPNH